MLPKIEITCKKSLINNAIEKEDIATEKKEKWSVTRKVSKRQSGARLFVNRISVNGSSVNTFRQ